MEIATNNLGMIITEVCNMNCAHCLQGSGPKRTMSREVMITTLRQFRYIANLSVCGGEPTLALKQMEDLFSYIVDNKIRVEGISTTINGTIYSDEFLRILAYIDDYMQHIDETIFEPSTVFFISQDKYHEGYMQELGITGEYRRNVTEYSKSPYFGGFSGVRKPIREGNAKELPWLETRRFSPSRPIIYYPEEKYIWIGPYIAIAPDGTVTEIDASILNQQTKYNYGNALQTPISDIFASHPKVRVLTKPNHNLNSFFDACDKSLRG